MKTKLHLVLLLLFVTLGVSAQTISIVGEAVGGWPDDNPATPDTHILSTTDNITYTIEGLTVSTATAGGGVKFRQDGAWTFNWGSSAFPTGVGTIGGSNIVTVAGNYNVTFNRLTGAYSFVPTSSFPNVGIIGSAVSSTGFDGPDQDMITFDGIIYTLSNYTFTTGEAKFRLNDAWEMSWGANTFPNGTAVSNGPNIPVSAGTYTVTFNIQTGVYRFEFIKIGIVGTAVSAGGFNDPDTMLTTSDGVHYTLYNHTFTDGVAKFKQDNEWTTNWGGGDFPAGIGSQNGPDIPVVAGVYALTFNRVTGAYSFNEPLPVLSVGIIGTAVNEAGFEGPDVDMATADGVNYTLENHIFTNGTAKFRIDNSWDTNYGGSGFPAGVGIMSGQNIPVVAGTYTVSFNTATFAYSFTGTPTHPTVGMIGTAVSTNGFEGQDTNMTTEDGITYTLTHTFLGGETKFRQDDAWAISWGGSGFPTGIPTSENIVVPAGTYVVTFNRITGDYSFVSPQIESVGILGTAVNADGFNGPDTNMNTTDGIIYTLEDFTFSTGAVKFRQNDSWDINWGGTTFPSGTATLNGPDIPVTAGIYDVVFNKATGTYSFAGEGFPEIGMIGTAVLPSGFNGEDVDMTTSDGINYNLNAYEFTTGAAKFRQDNSWIINWGGSTFPSGTGLQNGSDIPVAGNRYNVWFDRVNGEYAFNYVSIGLLGTALNGNDVPDTDMSTEDGITYTLVTDLNVGTLKVRENDSWTVNWGGVLTEPLTLDGPEIPITESGAGTEITFNRLTRILSIVWLGRNDNISSKISVSPNPSSQHWVFGGAAPIHAVELYDMLGKCVISMTGNSNELSVDGRSLHTGIYIAKVHTANGTDTFKLVKK